MMLLLGIQTEQSVKPLLPYHQLFLPVGNSSGSLPFPVQHLNKLDILWDLQLADHVLQTGPAWLHLEQVHLKRENSQFDVMYM